MLILCSSPYSSYGSESLGFGCGVFSFISASAFSPINMAEDMGQSATWIFTFVLSFALSELSLPLSTDSPIFMVLIWRTSLLQLASSKIKDVSSDVRYCFMKLTRSSCFVIDASALFSNLLLRQHILTFVLFNLTYDGRPYASWPVITWLKAQVSNSVFNANVATGVIKRVASSFKPSKRPPTSPNHSRVLYVYRSTDVRLWLTFIQKL